MTNSAIITSINQGTKVKLATVLTVKTLDFFSLDVGSLWVKEGQRQAEGERRKALIAAALLEFKLFVIKC